MLPALTLLLFGTFYFTASPAPVDMKRVEMAEVEQRLMEEAIEAADRGEPIPDLIEILPKVQAEER